MSKNKIYIIRILLPMTPVELARIDQCAALAKIKRTPFLRRLANLAWQDAVNCGMVKEDTNEQSNSARA